MLILILAGFSGSCKKDDCEPQKKPLLTEKEKSFIPNQPGDTLHFQDETGKRYFLTCKSKTLLPVTYIPEGHENSACKSIYETWDKLTARFEGNVVNDQNNALTLETRIEGGYDLRDPEMAPACNPEYKASFYLIFGSSANPTGLKQIYWGRTQETLLPIIINFGFKQEITLNGRPFQKVNMTSIASGCASYKPYTFGGYINSPQGLDSVYYSGQHGLIRLTTVGGKKYQRVL